MTKLLFSLLTFLSFNAFAQQPSAGCMEGNSALLSGNYTRAVSIWEPLAAQGDDCAQTKLGYMYQLGRGVAIDKVKAQKLFEAAAAQGNQEAALQVAIGKK